MSVKCFYYAHFRAICDSKVYCINMKIVWLLLHIPLDNKKFNLLCLSWVCISCITVDLI